MSKAAELAALIGSQTALSNRNLIINGAMQVAQRGTSFNFAHDGTRFGYTLDRWNNGMRATADELDHTVTQDSDVPSGSGFSNSFKWTTGTPETTVDADEYYYLYHPIEAQNCQHLCFGSSAAKHITLSFWVKSSITGTYGMLFYTQDAARGRNATYTINSANTWEYKTITIEGDTGGTITNDNGVGLALYWGIASGTDYNSTFSSSWEAYPGTNLLGGQATNGVVTTAGATWYITGVQLEVGETATPFEHRSYGDELQRCLRYYNSVGGGAPYQHFGVGVTDTTNRGEASFLFPVEMRAAPSISVSSSSHFRVGVGSNYAATGFSTDQTCSQSSRLLFNVSSGVSSGNATVISANNTTDARLKIDAEL